jgi:glycerol-3-phosphate cytidylyltransferase
MKKIITFGTFDVFHLGHLRLLRRAASIGDVLIVGVSTDALNFVKKNKYPVYPEFERMSIVKELRCVESVFYEESLEKKEEYIKFYEADVLVMGDDWAGRFDYLKDICEVVYLPRTPSISTTEIIERIRA